MKSKLARLSVTHFPHEIVIEETTENSTATIFIPKRIAIEIAIEIVSHWPIESADNMKEQIENLKNR
jgi:hypothetical protein